MASSTQDEILIAVIGVTGAGKSTFICKATGRDDLKVGKSLRSCTQEVAFSGLKIDGKTVKLIDTPGFDDTERSDTDILSSIAKFLVESYAENKLLTGIILLQPITGNRVYGTEGRRTRLFEKICGPNAFKNVIIASTMWSELKDKAEGIAREKERIESPDFWGKMVEAGAKVYRHENTQESAHRLIRKLYKKHTFVPQMQDELEKNNGMVSECEAGKQLYSDLSDTSRTLMIQLQEVRNEMSLATRENANLRQELRELQERFNAVKDQKDKLVSGKGLPTSLSRISEPQASSSSNDDCDCDCNCNPKCEPNPECAACCTCLACLLFCTVM